MSQVIRPELFGLNSCSDSGLYQRVRGVRIAGHLLREAFQSAEAMKSLGEKVRAIVPADSQLYWFHGGHLIGVPHPAAPSGSGYHPDPERQKERERQVPYLDAWMIAVCSHEFDPIEEGELIDWHDKELF